MCILVVGGAGYIGSHVCKALHEAGFSPVVYDHLQEGHKEAVKWGPLIVGNILDRKSLDKAFQDFAPQAVIHLASLIDCRESAVDPGKYYQNNFVGSLTLLQAMARHQVRAFVFSSTAAVYGIPRQVPIPEDHPCAPINVYGKTKRMVEEMLPDFYQAHQIRSVVLRYFNAAGADCNGEIGENHPHETHLTPLAILAALDKKPPLQIFGTDHPTPDGTPIRDYVHVTDLAAAHVKALEWLLKGGEPLTVNLGSGCGYSVHQVISSVEKKLGKPVPRNLGPRNPSDPPILVAEIEKARRHLGWKPENSDLDHIVSTAIQWHSKL